MIWNQPGSDVSGIMARSEKVVRTTEKVTSPTRLLIHCEGEVMAYWIVYLSFDPGCCGFNSQLG